MTEPMDVIFGFGQVGQALARELTRRGRKVRVVSRSGRGPVLDGVDHVQGDATSPAFCRAVCTGAEVVYFCLNAPYDRWATELGPGPLGGRARDRSRRRSLLAAPTSSRRERHLRPNSPSAPALGGGPGIGRERCRLRTRQSEWLSTAAPDGPDWEFQAIAALCSTRSA